MNALDAKVVDVKVPDGCNAILGQSHFIKTVEDLHEAMVNAVPARNSELPSANRVVPVWYVLKATILN